MEETLGLGVPLSEMLSLDGLVYRPTVGYEGFAFNVHQISIRLAVGGRLASLDHELLHQAVYLRSIPRIRGPTFLDAILVSILVQLLQAIQQGNHAGMLFCAEQLVHLGGICHPGVHLGQEEPLGLLPLRRGGRSICCR